MANVTLRVTGQLVPGPASPVAFNFKLGDRVTGATYVNVEPPLGFDFVVDVLPKVVSIGYNYLGQQYNYTITVTATAISATGSMATNESPVRFLNVQVEREARSDGGCLYIRPLLAGVAYNVTPTQTSGAEILDRTRWSAFVTTGIFKSASLPALMLNGGNRTKKFIQNIANDFLESRSRTALYFADAGKDATANVSPVTSHLDDVGIDVSTKSWQSIEADPNYRGQSHYWRDYGMLIINLVYDHIGSLPADFQPMPETMFDSIREAMLNGLPILFFHNGTGRGALSKLYNVFPDLTFAQNYSSSVWIQNFGKGIQQSKIWYGDHPAWDTITEDQFPMQSEPFVYERGAQVSVAASIIGEPIPEYPGTWYKVGCYDVNQPVPAPDAGGYVRADCCFYEDELYETEFTVEASFLQPSNWQSLLDRSLLDISWTGPFPSAELTLVETSAGNSVAKFKYSHIMRQEDSDTTVVLPITVTARDTRFKKLDVSDSQVIPVTIQLPCFTEGNEPVFTINDAQVTETDTGTQIMTFTVSASERVVGNSITIDYQTVDVTATSLSSSVQMQYALYDAQDRPFLGYLEYQKIRAVFDGSVPRYFNSRLNAVGYENVGPLLTNIVRWLDREERGNRILIIGDQENTASNYSVKGTDATGFGVNFVQHLTALGYNVDVLYVSEVAGGFPNDTYFDAYAVVIYLCTIAPLTISPVLTGAIERATKAGMGLYVLADHEPYYTANANAIAAKFVAKFQGNYNRTSGTNIDANRAARGDNPFIVGLTGTMPGDVSESVVVTDGSIVVQADYENTSGTLTFAQGERSKTLQVTIINDDLEEGTELFHMELSPPSRGSLDREYGVGTILDDDVVPFGTAQGSGGSGVVFRSLGYANKTGVFIVAWNAFGAHDRFDLFRQGAFLCSSNEDVDRNYAINNSLPKVVPAYDKLAWEAAGGTPSAAIFDVHQRLPNRAGSSIMCIPHYAELGYAPVYDIRCEGPNGTGWDFITTEDDVRPCVGPGQVALNVDNGRFKRERVLLHDMSQNLTENSVTFRLTLNNLGQNNTAGSPTYVPPVGTSGTPFDVNNCSAVDVPVRVVLRRVGQVMAISSWIAPGSSGLIEWNFNKTTDFKYLEVVVEVDPNGIANYVTEWRPDASYNMATANQSKPVRSNWNYTIEVV